MFHVDEVLSKIRPGDRVLDVGGWACPFNRADWVLDREPYETRGYYGTIGLPPSQGGAAESFSEATWVRRDICDHEPWPFPDKYFDFAVCSHTLEDVRDPLFVCRELMRVAKRGYVETPSRLAESCRGWESEAIVGLSHHRWLVDYRPGGLDFTMKYHMIHGDPALSFGPVAFRDLDPEDHIAWLFWEDRFEVSERIIHGIENQRQFLLDFVGRRGRWRWREQPAKALAPAPAPAPAPAEADGATRAELEQARARLAEYGEIGPIALGLARRLRGASQRFPRASSAIKPLFRLARRGSGRHAG